MSIMLGGKIVSTSKQMQTVTAEEYAKLSVEEQMNGNAYFISDSFDDEYKKLIHMGTVIGNDEDLAGYADGTVIGAIVDLYNRLGGMSLQLDANNNIEFVYNDEDITPAESAGHVEYLTDAEKINHMEDVIGTEDDLYNLGYPTLVSAIRGLYSKLNGISMSYNDETQVLKLSYSDDAPR